MPHRFGGMGMDRMAEIEALVEEHRATCLWFFDAAFRPDTPAKAMRALESIVRHGGRQAFIRASELKQWLSRTSSETSSG
ncbi:MAG: hypothetical protein KJ579_04780 [Verrucomicrobia bacterium]|nr:hypothetical protein [Verrucomicrobiota bacterium]